MRLLTKDTDYAIRALCDMALQPEGAITSVAELSRRLKLPRPYLRRILQTLARGGILKSSRGTGGGFALAKAPDGINVSDLASAFQGPLDLAHCVMRAQICPNVATCPLRKRIQHIEATIRHELGSITIASLL
jgi:Rrf2 family protein